MALGQNLSVCPANTRGVSNVGSMLERRRRRRANIEPTLDTSLVFAGCVWVGGGGGAGGVIMTIFCYH